MAEGLARLNDDGNREMEVENEVNGREAEVNGHSAAEERAAGEVLAEEALAEEAMHDGNQLI